MKGLFIGIVLGMSSLGLTVGDSRADSTRPCATELINWSSFDETLRDMSRTYHQLKFTELEATLDCLMDSEKEFSTGKSGAIAVYWFYRNEMPSPGADSDDDARITKWRSEMPGSKFAHFATLRLMYAQAWNARGRGLARETTQEQFDRHNALLLETEAAILADDNKLGNTPISQNLLLAVALDARGTRNTPMDIFQSGIAKWPRYFDFYEIILTRLVPKWGGDWETVDNFIKFWAEQLQDSEGESMYARLYYFVHSRGNDYRLTQSEWPVLKSSLKSLLAKYPATNHQNMAASYACLYKDRQFYLEHSSASLAGLEPGTDGWLPKSSRELCDNFLSVVR